MTFIICVGYPGLCNSLLNVFVRSLVGAGGCKLPLDPLKLLVSMMIWPWPATETGRKYPSVERSNDS